MTTSNEESKNNANSNFAINSKREKIQVYLFLGLLGLFYFNPILSLLMSFPMSMFLFKFELRKGTTFILGAILLLFLLGVNFQSLPLLSLVMSGVSYFIGFKAYKAVKEYKNPMHEVFKLASVLALIILGSLYVVISGSQGAFKKEFISAVETQKIKWDESLKETMGTGDKDRFELMAMLDQPEFLYDEMLKQSPGFIVSSLIFIVWLNVFLILRYANRMSYQMSVYDEKGNLGTTEKLLFNFRVPDFLVWPTIIVLALSLFRDQVGETMYVIGSNCVVVFGVLFFFQGISLYNQFLDYIKMRGFWKTFFLMFTILGAFQFVALMGLMDNFFNLKSKLVQKVE